MPCKINEETWKGLIERRYINFVKKKKFPKKSLSNKNKRIYFIHQFQ